MNFQHFKEKTTALVIQAFRPGTAANHVMQADTFIIFCDNYRLQFIDPAPSTLAYYIMHLSLIFTSSKDMRNYVSRAQFLHKSLALALEDITSLGSKLDDEDPTPTLPSHPTPAPHPTLPALL